MSKKNIIVIGLILLIGFFAYQYFKTPVEAPVEPEDLIHDDFIADDLIPDDLIYDQEQSRQLVEMWIKNSSPTYTFDGMNLVFQESLELDLEDCQNCYQFVYDFESRQAGYGDRSEEMLAQVITPHTVVVTVEDGEITGAVIDETYDDLNQEMIQE